MAEITYSEKLRHPLWQKRRLEIFNRDNFSCAICGDSETELHCHHRRYDSFFKEPWDYPDDLLVTLCKNCHASETADLRDACEYLIEVVKSRFFASDIRTIANALNYTEADHPEVLSSIIEFGLLNPYMSQLVNEKYWDVLSRANANMKAFNNCPACGTDLRGHCRCKVCGYNPITNLPIEKNQ